MKKTKTQKGITLVALIITIVVLLILAAVTIGAVRDSNIIAHAQNVASAYNTAKNNEESLLAEYENEIEKNIPGGQIEEVQWGEYQGMLVYIGDSKNLVVTTENITVKTLQLDEDEGTFTETEEVKESTFSNYTVIYFTSTPDIQTVDFGNKLSSNNQLLFGSSSEIKEIKGLEGLTGFTMNETGSFENCEKLEKIIIPSTVTQIKGVDFNNCKALTSIEIPSTVTSIFDNAFNGCTNLSKIIIHQEDSSVLGEGWIPSSVPAGGIEYVGISE